MKRLLVCLLCVILLTGCSEITGIDRCNELRNHILASPECSFTAEITADYGDALYQFTVCCGFDSLGNMQFSVIQPDSISGVSGKIEGEMGFLTFDDQVLAFPLLADGQLTPVSAPWIFMKVLRSGYIHSSAREDDLIYVCLDDSYGKNALQVDLWLSSQNVPVRAEILYDDCRILSISITEFAYA